MLASRTIEEVSSTRCRDFKVRLRNSERQRKRETEGDRERDKDALMSIGLWARLAHGGQVWVIVGSASREKTGYRSQSPRQPATCRAPLAFQIEISLIQLKN